MTRDMQLTLKRLARRPRDYLGRSLIRITGRRAMAGGIGRPFASRTRRPV